MKSKTVSALLCAAMTAVVVAGCGSSTGSHNSSSSSSDTVEISTESAATDYSAIAAQTIAAANTKGTRQDNYDSKVQQYADANTLESVLGSHKNALVTTQIIYDDGSEIDATKYYDKNGCIYKDSDGTETVKVGDTVFTRSDTGGAYKALLDIWPDESAHTSSAAVLNYGFPQDPDMVFADPTTENGQAEIEVTNQKTGLQGSLNFDADSKELTNYFYMVVDPETGEMTVTSYNDDYQYDVDEQTVPSDLAEAVNSASTYKVTVIFDPSESGSVTRTYTVPKGYAFQAANGTASDGTYKYELYTDSACSNYYTEGSGTDTDMTLYAAKVRTASDNSK